MAIAFYVTEDKCPHCNQDCVVVYTQGDKLSAHHRNIKGPWLAFVETIKLTLFTNIYYDWSALSSRELSRALKDKHVTKIHYLRLYSIIKYNALKAAKM